MISSQAEDELAGHYSQTQEDHRGPQSEFVDEKPYYKWHYYVWCVVEGIQLRVLQIISFYQVVQLLLQDGHIVHAVPVSEGDEAAQDQDYPLPF